jgi:dinuclear metal center YbgI/SA1388 family protein
MVTREHLAQSLADLLEVNRVKDYCPNGLQIEGRATIHKIVTGVTASLALVEAAIAADADALIVHHGYFWQQESPCITQAKRARIARLLAHDINLFAYHLPLDIHPVLGNNTQLAAHLAIPVIRAVEAGGVDQLLQLGELPVAQTATDFAKHLSARLGREPLLISGGEHSIKRLAWCTGAAQRYIDVAHAQGADAYISGEVSEATTHFAKENGIHYYVAGHHATERYGVQALGQYLANEYQLEHVFIDIDNPV